MYARGPGLSIEQPAWTFRAAEPPRCVGIQDAESAQQVVVDGAQGLRQLAPRRALGGWSGSLGRWSGSLERHSDPCRPQER